ncbi:MAG: mRNA turnover 4 family protein [Promethearchaeia archaeon]
MAKQGRKRKEAIVETILECLDNYSHVYVYNMGNVRTGIVKTLRNKFAEDRFVMGKQTVMALGVGRSAEEEPRDNLHKLSQHLTGTAGLLFSNRPQEEVVAFFRSFREEEFATAGTPATADYVLEVGPLGFQHTMADPLRKLGLPVMLKNGAIVCEAKHKVCSKGKPLTPEQAQVLKLMDVKMGHVQLELKCVWTDGSYTELSG